MGKDTLHPDQRAVTRLLAADGPKDWFAIRRHLYEIASDTRAAETARQLAELVGAGHIRRLGTGEFAIERGMA